jgi:hypothetical protein
MSQQRSIRWAALQHARQITALLGHWADDLPWRNRL